MTIKKEVDATSPEVRVLQVLFLQTCHDNDVHPVIAGLAAVHTLGAAVETLNECEYEQLDEYKQECLRLLGTYGLRQPGSLQPSDN